MQTKLTHFFAEKISKKIHTKVSVKSVDISFFSSLILNDIYIEDLQNDTLLYVKSIDANVLDFSIKYKNVVLKKLTFDRVNFCLKTDSNNKTNLQFIIDSLFTKTADTTKSDWNIFCSNFYIKNSRFSYKAFNSKNTNYGINFKNVSVNNINLQVSYIKTFSDSIKLKIRNLTAKEKSGFIINNLNSDFLLSNKKIKLDNVNLTLNNSNIKAKIFAMTYKRFADFSDFLNKIKLISDFDSSKINFSDIAFFAPELKNINQEFFISGKIKGKIANLKSKNLKLYIGKNTFVNAKINITGLPNIYETFIYADIKKLYTQKTDLNKILKNVLPNNNINIPDNITKLGLISYKGNFTGFINDFVAYGNFNTQIGKISTDISLKTDTVLKIKKFNGKLIADNFNLGKVLINDSIIGNINLDINIDAVLKNNTNLKGNVEGKISSIEINKYNYRNVKIDGDFVNKMFDGHLNFNDTNIIMDFLGRFDFNKPQPILDFTADIKKIKLDKINLNYINTDTNSTLSMLLIAKINGLDINNFYGNLDIFNLKYFTKDKLLSANKIQLRTDKVNNGKKITFNSDFADITITGKYNFINIINSFEHITNVYIPNIYTSKLQQLTDTNNFIFDITFHKTSKIFDILLPKYFISENSTISGKFNDTKNNIELNGKFDTLKIKNNLFTKVIVKTRTNNDSTFFTKFNAKKSKIAGTLPLTDLKFKTITKNNKTNFNLNWYRKDSTIYSGDISAYTILKKNKNYLPVIYINFLPSDVIIADSLWFISDSKIIIDTTSINIQNFIFNKNNQYIYANGKISELKTDSLKLDFNDVELKNINFYIKQFGFDFKGKLNGYTYLNNFYNNFNFISNLNINKLFVNNEQIGNTHITNKWDNKNKKFILDAYAMRGKLKTINLKGNIYPDTKKIDMLLSLNKLRLNTFNPLLKGVASELNGIASGNIKINGNISKPITQGRLKLQKTSFKIDYLNTKYYFTNYVDISANKINFDNLKIFDEKGNSAIVNGNISHKFFKNFNFNISINANKLKVLDTKESDNQLFYGKTFASGLFKISGTPDNIFFDINATTNKNTRFFIPVTSTETSESANFIRFVNKDTLLVKKTEYKVDLSGMQLNFDLNITPDAEIQIIFDKKVGDIIKSKGNGNINLKIDTKGEFKINGEYKIEKGDYLFTLQNIINKHFDIEKGSSIKWNGDPYNADINIDAIYRTKTSLYNLTLDTLDKTKLPVQCKLLMTNNLLNPKIKFKIDVPNANDRAQAIINSFTEDQTNKQMLSLLVINSFYTPENLRGTNVTETKSSGNALGVNSSELLSNQLSHWLSQISNDFDIGVNYRPGDQITTDELEVALSTQILNDRVTINGNFGVGGNSQNTTNSTSGIAGNVDINVKINKSGSLQMKGYTKSNNDVVYNTSPTTQGVGIFYTDNFDTFGELLNKYWHKIFKNKKQKNN